MGQFSWLDCVTKEQILDGVCRNSYLLVPKQFGGGHIKETCYDGYGRFGEFDVYDLVLDWNKDMIPEVCRRIKNGTWKASRSENDIKDLMAYYETGEITKFGNCLGEKRHLGITLACYDEDNMSLEYPIKITHDPNVAYEDCDYSPSDPHQGWSDWY